MTAASLSVNGDWFSVRDGILVIPKNTTVPDYTDLTR
jgi:hypothetical protein